MDIGVIRSDGRSDAFFAGAAEDRLVIKRCEPCDHWYPPDTSDCPTCGGQELVWAAASGAAVLVSWAVAHDRTPGEGSPALLALVELAEGPWLYGRLDEVPAEALREGLPLRARFEHPDEGESYPVFQPVR